MAIGDASSARAAFPSGLAESRRQLREAAARAEERERPCATCGGRRFVMVDAHGPACSMLRCGDGCPVQSAQECRSCAAEALGDDLPSGSGS